MNFLYNIPKNKKTNDYQHNPNIIDAAARAFKKMVNYEEIVCCAEMQSGKTEVMKRMIYIINNCGDKLSKHDIDIDQHNIHLILCASSVNLKNQLKEKLPEIKHKIYHLNDINKIIKNVFENESLLMEMSSSSLIIFDECHCDAEKQKIIDKFRHTLQITSKRNKTTFYKIGFSATPYEHIIGGYTRIIMKPGPDYYGLVQMLESENIIVHQSKDLDDENECANLFTEIDIHKFYYIFRLPCKKTNAEIAMNNINSHFKNAGLGLNTYIYDMTWKSNINDILREKPIKPTVIYLKDKLRMGEYLNTEFVYLVHDDPHNKYTHTTAQSLIGRCCGYQKSDHCTLIYCDYDKAYEHYEWIKHNYDIEYIPLSAKYIKKNGSGTKDKCIY